MSRDWHKDHALSPEAYPDSEYLDWAQDNGLYVDAAGNVDYGPPEPCSEQRDRYPNPWERWLGFVPGERNPWIDDNACRCPDCGRAECTGEDCYWPDEAGLP